MFLTERPIPRIALQCQALIRNLPQDHPKLLEIQAELSKRMSGYYGEKSLDYHLGALSQEKYDIIPGLRLANNERNFQIDTVILSNNYLLVIEIKNLSGELEFDTTNGQLIQRKGDVIKVYEDPFAQVKQQRLQLLLWLEKQKIPPIPIDFLVVLSNNNALIKKVTGASNNYWRLSRGINSFEKITNLENNYQKEFISTKDRKKLGKMLLKNNTPLEIDILKRFNIAKTEILPGVQCPSCLARPMIHTYGTWFCQNCDLKSKTAHLQKIQDYFLIMGPSISNSELREFALVDQRQVANRILNSMGLPYQGANRGRVYFPSPPQK